MWDHTNFPCDKGVDGGGGGGCEGEHDNINLYRHADLILFHGEFIPPFLIILQNQ